MIPTIILASGYHPWSSHHISIGPVSSKDDHYRNLLFSDSSPTPEHLAAFDKLLPSLPDPISLGTVLSELRSNLEAFPQAMLGEVGLDRACRIPYDYNALSRELSPFSVPFDHQIVVLTSQLDLAVQLSRNVSIHSVKSQRATVDLFTQMKAKHGEKWTRINVDMHSCSVSPETWRDLEAWRHHSQRNVQRSPPPSL